jgi:hypothetical protein
MRILMAATLAVSLFACATSISTPWSQTPETARASIREYYHHAGGYSAQFYATFERAMTGDFTALHTILTDPAYQGQDTSFDDMVSRQLLVLLGDKRFSDFVSAQSPADRDSFVGAVGPGLDTNTQQETYFAKHYPKMYALWKSYGPFSAHTIQRLRKEVRAQGGKKA